MICIAIFQPDGTGGYSSDPWGAWTSSDVDVVQSSITFKANTLTSVDRLGNTFDASRAQGGVPSPITGSFSVADTLAIGRISSDLFSGAAPLMGWRVRIWLGLRRDGSDLSEPWNQGEFACSGADHDSDAITISVIQTYALNARTIGTGVAGQVLGLVVGQHEVVVPTPELPAPVAIERTDLAGDGNWHTGIPGAPLPITVTATRATSKADLGGGLVRFWFRCADYTSAYELRNLLNARGAEIVATGKKFASALVPYSGLYDAIRTSPNYEVGVQVTQDFYDSESPEDVGLYFRDATTPIVAGAASLIGWIDGERTVTPLSDVSVDTQTWVLSARPQILTADGFASLTRVDCTIGWADGATAPNGSTLIYYGNVGNVRTTGDSAGAYDTYNAITLTPTGSPSTVSIWAKSGTYVTLPLRLSVRDEDAQGFDGYVVDFAARAIWKNDDAPAHGYLFFPWSNQKFENEAIATGQTITHSPELLGPGANVKSQRFADIDEANVATTAGIVAYSLDASPNLYLNIQLAAVHIYGVSYLSPGSTEAIVKPGPSIYPGSSVSTITAAQYILQEAGGVVYNVNDTFGNFGPVNQAWLGAYIEPDKTLAEAAHDLANDLWYVLPPASNRTQLAAMPEVFEAPEVPLGRLEDVVTEPVIEYGNGLRAYIQNIDREFDPARPDDFYGGWGFLRDDITGTPLINYGSSAWSTCRDAYLRHGIKASETFKAPSIQEADALGYIWTQTNRNGLSRLEWLANPPRFARFKVATDAPGYGFAWAGTRITIPQRMASYAGYDWSDWGVATEGATITEASIDPISLEITYTVILPPTLEIPGASGWINDSETGDFINDAETGDFINDATR